MSLKQLTIFVENKKLSISIASVSLSSAKIHFALNMEDKGTPDDVETIGLFDIKVNGEIIIKKGTKVTNEVMETLKPILADGYGMIDATLNKELDLSKDIYFKGYKENFYKLLYFKYRSLYRRP
mgnify:CR=1 FL=1